MYKGANIFIDDINKVVFIGAGERMTEESIKALKNGLDTDAFPYKAVYVLENINSVQYVSEQKVVEINNDGTFKYD